MSSSTQTLTATTVAEVTTTVPSVRPELVEAMAKLAAMPVAPESTFAVPPEDVLKAYQGTGYKAVNRTWYSHGGGCAMAVLGRFLTGNNHNADRAMDSVKATYGVGDEYMGALISGFDAHGGETDPSLTGVRSQGYANGVAIRQLVKPTGRG